MKGDSTGVKRKVVLAASLAVGVLAAVLTRFYVAAREAEVANRLAQLHERYGAIEVLCFKRDVPGGTEIVQSDLGLKEVPALGMRGQALQRDSLGDVVGRRTVVAHKRGDVVFWSDIEGGDPSARPLSADVKRQMRAISISCGGASSVSGQVRPNDHVDVIATFDFAEAESRRASGKGELVTCTILQNVLVLATGKDTAKSRARSLGVSPQGYSTVTLEVTPREAEMLAFAEQIKGRLVLTLRNRNDTSYERELPKVDFDRIRGEIEELNLKRQQRLGGR